MNESELRWVESHLNVLVRRRGGYQCLLWPRATRSGSLMETVRLAMDLEKRGVVRSAPRYEELR